MSRNLDSGTIAAIESQRLLLAVFFYGKFADGEVRVWSGMGPISWAGNTWLGLGQPGGECLGQISTISESSDLQAQGVTVTLSGVDPQMLNEAMNNIVQGYPARIWVNMFDDSLNVIGSILTFGGLIDQPTITEGATTCTIELSLESRLSDLQRAQMRRWTDQDQRMKHPTDTGFSFVNEMQLWACVWGGS